MENSNIHVNGNNTKNRRRKSDKSRCKEESDKNIIKTDNISSDNSMKENYHTINYRDEYNNYRSKYNFTHEYFCKVFGVNEKVFALWRKKEEIYDPYIEKCIYDVIYDGFLCKDAFVCREDINQRLCEWANPSFFGTEYSGITNGSVYNNSSYKFVVFVDTENDISSLRSLTDKNLTPEFDRVNIIFYSSKLSYKNICSLFFSSKWATILPTDSNNRSFLSTKFAMDITYYHFLLNRNVTFIIASNDPTKDYIVEQLISYGRIAFLIDTKKYYLSYRLATLIGYGNPKHSEFYKYLRLKNEKKGKSILIPETYNFTSDMLDNELPSMELDDDIKDILNKVKELYKIYGPMTLSQIEERIKLTDDEKNITKNFISFLSRREHLGYLSAKIVNYPNDEKKLIIKEEINK